MSFFPKQFFGKPCSILRLFVVKKVGGPGFFRSYTAIFKGDP